jgi:hypothetical protein
MRRTSGGLEDIKRKDFAVVTALTDAKVCAADFSDVVLAQYRAAAPFIRFLSNAVALV